MPHASSNSHALQDARQALSADDAATLLSSTNTCHRPSLVIQYQAPNPAITIGRQLSDARRKAQLTQVELSALTGVDQAVISRIERGRANPTLSMLQTLARPLELQVALIPTSLSDQTENS